MAEVVDYVEPEGEFADVTNEEPKQETFAEEPEPKVEDELPEKYRGKSAKDLALIALEQEKMIGRQAQEVGEVRKLADELIKSQLKPKPEIEKPQEVDFFENPQEAIRQAVANSPDVLNAKQMAIQVQQEQAKRAFEAKHPDYESINNDPGFADWIKSSQIRTKLYQMAANYDVNAADELFSTYKQLKGIKQTQETSKMSETEKNARDKALRSATVDKGGSGESSKKIYRRADLIRLKMNDPKRYDALSDEIMRAYSEGRVK